MGWLHFFQGPSPNVNQNVQQINHNLAGVEPCTTSSTLFCYVAGLEPCIQIQFCAKNQAQFVSGVERCTTSST